MTVSPYEMRKNGWTATSGTTEGLVSFEIQDKKETAKDSGRSRSLTVTIVIL